MTGNSVRMKESSFRVAVYGLESPEAGGAHNAENLMIKQINKVLKEQEVVLIYPKQNKYPQWGILKRSHRFLRTIYTFWRFNPIFWATIHRVSRLPVTRLERQLLRKGVDLVFFVGPYDHAIELRKIPFIATIWDLGHRDLPALPEMSANREFELREWRLRNIATKAVAIVTDSEITKIRLENLYGIVDSKIHPLPFCPQVLESLVQQDRENYAFYPAHFWSHKNHIVLLEAISLLISSGRTPRKLKLTGLDRGNLQYLRDKVIELEISEFIEFLGFVSVSDLDKMYRTAAILVMPSLLGPTNLPPLESLLRGCPVAVSNNAGANLSDWRGVITLDGHEVDAWADALDADYTFDSVDLPTIQKHIAETEASNLKKLTSIFEDFKKDKRTFSY